MTGHFSRIGVLCFATAAVLSGTGPATAASFDGNWNMTAVTTRGHCGSVPIGMGITRGRLFSTGGFFALYPISLSGRISGSGHISIKAVAGPRVAQGTGRLSRGEGKGTWKGRGPSGLCSGYWRATRG